jgi:hypothetical protein
MLFKCPVSSTHEVHNDFIRYMLQVMFLLNCIPHKYINTEIIGYGLDVRGYVSGRSDISLLPTTSRTDLRAHLLTHAMASGSNFFNS